MLGRRNESNNRDLASNASLMGWNVRKKCSAAHIGILTGVSIIRPNNIFISYFYLGGGGIAHYA